MRPAIIQNAIRPKKQKKIKTSFQFCQETVSKPIRCENQFTKNIEYNQFHLNPTALVRYTICNQGAINSMIRQDSKKEPQKLENVRKIEYNL